MKKSMAVLCLVLGLLSCQGRKRASPADAFRFEQLRRNAQTEFDKMHLIGWEKAAEGFEAALNIKEDVALRRQLFYTDLLIFIREGELNYRHNRRWLDKARGDEARLSAKDRKERAYLQCLEANMKGENSQIGFDINPKTVPIHVLFVHYYLSRAWESDKMSPYENALRTRSTGSNLAYFLFNRADYKLDKINQLLSKYPDFLEVHLQRSEFLKYQGKFWSALEDLHTVLDLLPEWVEINNSIGKMLSNLGLHELALPHYEQVLGAAGDDYEALHGKALCLSALKRYEESNAVLRKMLADDIIYGGEVHYYLAFNDYCLDKKDEARAMVEQARRLMPDSADMNMISGIMFIEKNQFQEAKADFERAINADRGRGDAHYYLGLIHYQNGEMEPAKRFYQEAAGCYWRVVLLEESRLAQIAASDLPEAQKSFRLKQEQAALQGMLTAYWSRLNSARQLFDQSDGLETLINTITNLDNRLRFVKPAGK